MSHRSLDHSVKEENNRQQKLSTKKLLSFMRARSKSGRGKVSSSHLLW